MAKKYITIVYGQTIEADTLEELNELRRQVMERHQVAVSKVPFLRGDKSPVSTDPGRKVSPPAVQEATEEEEFSLSEPPEVVLPEEPVDESLEEPTSPEAATEQVENTEASSEEPVAEEATAPDVVEEDLEETIEIPENLDELPREELVKLAKQLDLDTRGNRKAVLNRIKRYIEEAE